MIGQKIILSHDELSSCFDAAKVQRGHCVGRNAKNYKRNQRSDTVTMALGVEGHRVFQKLFPRAVEHKDELSKGTDGGVDFWLDGHSVDVKTLNWYPNNVQLLATKQNLQPGKAKLFAGINRLTGIGVNTNEIPNSHTYEFIGFFLTDKVGSQYINPRFGTYWIPSKELKEFEELMVLASKSESRARL